MVNKNVVFQIEMRNVIFFRLHYTTIVRLETCENFHKVPRTNRFSIFKKKVEHSSNLAKFGRK